jgi:DNA-directed RNA polymerase specialized sigma24 family protein
MFPQPPPPAALAKRPILLQMVKSVLRYASRNLAWDGGVSRFDEIAALTPELHRFLEGLTVRRGGACVPKGRIEAKVQAAAASALKDFAAASPTQVKISLFAAAIEQNRTSVRQEKFADAAEPVTGQRFVERRAEAAAHVSEKSTEHRAAQEALALLSEQSREALLLIVLARFSYCEAAQALGVSLSETFARLTRARAAFGALLERREQGAARAAAIRVVSGAGATSGRRMAAAQHLRLVK